jgi:outer membrane protein assembly factor BamB
VLWRRPIGRGYSSPVVAGSRLVVSHRLADDSIVECFAAETGESLWRYVEPAWYVCEYDYSDGPYSSPLVDGDLVYSVSAEGALVALDLATGEFLWRRDLERDFQPPEGLFAVGAGLCVDENRLIFNVGAGERNAGVVALDKNTGETLWTSSNHRPSYATPLAIQRGDRRLALVLTFEGLAAFDSPTGELLWSIPFRSQAPDSVNAVSPVVWNDLVLAVTGPGPGAVCLRLKGNIDEGDGYQEVWRDRRALDSQFNGLAVAEGHVFGYTSSRQGGSKFRCVDFATGEVKWEWESDLGRGSLVAVDGRLILWGERGDLAVLELRTDAARVLWQSRQPLLSAPCYASPALAGGRVYLRNESYLVCLNLGH